MDRLETIFYKGLMICGLHFLVFFCICVWYGAYRLATGGFDLLVADAELPKCQTKKEN